MTKENDKDQGKQPGTVQPPGPPSPPAPPAPEMVKRVQITCNERTRVGRKLLKNGDVTDDPAYVALLDDPRGLVRAID